MPFGTISISPSAGLCTFPACLPQWFTGKPIPRDDPLLQKITAKDGCDCALALDNKRDSVLTELSWNGSHARDTRDLINIYLLFQLKIFCTRFVCRVTWINTFLNPCKVVFLFFHFVFLSIYNLFIIIVTYKWVFDKWILTGYFVFLFCYFNMKQSKQLVRLLSAC